MDGLKAVLTGVECPDAALNQRFDRARDAVRHAESGSIPDPALIPALLALGDHGAALDRLRALRPLTAAQSELLALYAVWSGDQRWLAQLGAEALRETAGTPPPPARFAAQALAAWCAGEPVDGAAAAGMASGAITALWGVEPNAAGESVGITPTLPPEWKHFALRNLRIGETLLDLTVKRTRHGLGLSVQKTRGPALRMVLTVPGSAEYEVDGHQLAGGRAVFRVEGEHSVSIDG